MYVCVDRKHKQAGSQAAIAVLATQQLRLPAVCMCAQQLDTIDSYMHSECLFKLYSLCPPPPIDPPPPQPSPVTFRQCVCVCVCLR